MLHAGFRYRPGRLKDPDGAGRETRELPVSDGESHLLVGALALMMWIMQVPLDSKCNGGLSARYGLRRRPWMLMLVILTLLSMFPGQV
jgi:hypothetical protein